MAKLIDLTGQKFGRLTVIKRGENIGKNVAWICKCQCGKEKLIRGTDLKQGKTKSCGCLQREVTILNSEKNSRVKVGDIFGSLEVIQDLGLKDTGESHRRRVSLCKCLNCGSIKEYPNHSLLSGNTKSCGCLQFMRPLGIGIKDKTGQKFNNLTVLKVTNERTSYGQVLWICKCDCGRIIKLPTGVLGKQKTCGKCLKKQSFGAQKISKILRDNNLLYEKEKIMPNSLNPETKGTPRFDFYVDNDYFIEFDGIQHYQSGNGLYNNKENFEKIKRRDQFKNNWCEENNFTLIRIPYYKEKDLTIEDLIPETSKFVVTRKKETLF